MQTETTTKPTPGPWRVTGQYVESASAMDGTQIIATFGNSRGDSNRNANAALSAEAGTVYHELGLTPRQLADQRAELMAALELALGWLDEDRLPQSCGACGTPNASCDGDCMAASYLSRDRLTIRAQIARAKGLAEVPK